MSKVFNYVIARPWKESEPDSLCIYAYGSEVQRGTREQADGMLSYVNKQNPVEGTFSIYKVKYKKIET